MVLNFLAPDPIPDEQIPDDGTTLYTARTPPETTSDFEFFNSNDPLADISPSGSSVPWPGSTFIIRSTRTGHVLTLQNGQVVLAPPGVSGGSIHWACVEAKGWMGFRNTVAGRFLGHDKDGKLRCSADRQQQWEHFTVRLRPNGGYILYMTHFERLWNVGFKIERGVEKLAKVEDSSEGIVWEFVKVS